MRILDGVLTKEQKEAGFYLEEDTDMFIHLRREGLSLATFSQVGATIDAIRRAADQQLNWLMSGITFGRRK